MLLAGPVRYRENQEWSCQVQMSRSPSYPEPVKILEDWPGERGIEDRVVVITHPRAEES